MIWGYPILTLRKAPIFSHCYVSQREDPGYDQVVVVLKSLIEDGQLALPDGRRPPGFCVVFGRGFLSWSPNRTNEARKVRRVWGWANEWSTFVDTAASEVIGVPQNHWRRYSKWPINRTILGFSILRNPNLLLPRGFLAMHQWGTL